MTFNQSIDLYFENKNLAIEYFTQHIHPSWEDVRARLISAITKLEPDKFDQSNQYLVGYWVIRVRYKIHNLNKPFIAWTENILKVEPVFITRAVKPPAEEWIKECESYIARREGITS